MLLIALSAHTIFYVSEMLLFFYNLSSRTVHCMCVCFFFFKQKTAYEMRISDWSSDVCSSDLRLARVRHDRPLAGDRRQFLRRRRDLLGVLDGLAHAHVDHDLLDPRRLHGVLVRELLYQGGADHLIVVLLQPGHGAHRSITSPERLANRTLRPSSRTLKPTRVGLPSCGSTWATLETSIVASFSTMPPAEVDDGRVWQIGRASCRERVCQ